MEGLTITVVVVDDYQPFRAFVCSTLQKKPGFQVVHEASDGLEAVTKAQELQPDLIVLDIGLPKLNGIEAARQIRKLSSQSKILFVSQESSADVVEEALSLGAWGYVVKAHAGSELLAAVEAVCQGRHFVSKGLSGHNVTEAKTTPASDRLGHTEALPSVQPRARVTHSHEVQFFPDDASFLTGLTGFIKAALERRRPVIMISTEPRRSGVLERLEARGWDITAALGEGSYISLDVSDLLETFMVNDWPDSARLLETTGDLIRQASQASKGERTRVACWGECAPTLLTQGKVDAAIQVEHLCDAIARSYDVDILCGYLSNGFERKENSHIYERICREHSAVVTTEKTIPMRRHSAC